MENNDIVVKAAEEKVNRNECENVQPGPTPDAMRRENICERWKKAIEDRRLYYPVPLPKTGKKPSNNAKRDGNISISYIRLSMQLVYDRELNNNWEGEYAIPDIAPEVEIAIYYKGHCVNEKLRVLEIACKIISAHIGKPVPVTKDDWMDPEYCEEIKSNLIDSIILDWDTAWNIADFLLTKNSYKGDSMKENDSVN